MICWLTFMSFINRKLEALHGGHYLTCLSFVALIRTVARASSVVFIRARARLNRPGRMWSTASARSSPSGNDRSRSRDAPFTTSMSYWTKLLVRTGRTSGLSVFRFFSGICLDVLCIFSVLKKEGFFDKQIRYFKISLKMSWIKVSSKKIIKFNI